MKINIIISSKRFLFSGSVLTRSNISRYCLTHNIDKHRTRVIISTYNKYVDLVLCRHMASLCHDELNHYKNSRDLKWYCWIVFEIIHTKENYTCTCGDDATTHKQHNMMRDEKDTVLIIGIPVRVIQMIHLFKSVMVPTHEYNGLCHDEHF